MRKKLLYLVFIILVINTARAATYTAAAGTNDWGMAAFGANTFGTDDVIVPNGATVNIPVDVQCKNLTIENGGKVQFTANTTYLWMRNGSILDIQAGGLLTCNGFRDLSIYFNSNANNVFRCDGVCDMSDLTNPDINSLKVDGANALFSMEGAGTIVFHRLHFNQSDATASLAATTILKMRHEINFLTGNNIIFYNYGSIFCNRITVDVVTPGTGCEFHNMSGATAHVGWGVPGVDDILEPLSCDPIFKVYAEYPGNLVDFCGTAPLQYIATPVNGYYDVELSYKLSTNGVPPINHMAKVPLWDIDIINSLTLSNGFIDFSQSFSNIRLLNGAGNALSYTNGAIGYEQLNPGMFKWSIGTSNGPHVIPFFITSGENIPFTFDLVSGDAGEVSVSTYGTAQDNQPFPFSPLPVFNLSSATMPDNSDAVVDRFWQIDMTGETAPVANLTFTYTASELPVAPYDDPLLLRAQDYNFMRDYWMEALPGQTTPGYSVTVPNVTRLKQSVWTLATGLSPLPVTVMSFGAQRHPQGVKLNWQVGNEADITNYIVEKSYDGIDYTVLETIRSANQADQVSTYELVDKTAHYGVMYYRLKKTEAGQVSEPLGWACFEDQELKPVPSIFPLPNCGEYIRVDRLPVNTRFTIRIMNTEGKLLFEDTTQTNTNGEPIDIRFPEKLSAGVYSVSICSLKEKYHYIMNVD